MRASLRVDSIIGWINPSRKIQNVEILYAGLRVDSSYGGVNLGKKYRILFLLCVGKESTLEEIKSTPAQEGSTSAFIESTLALLIHFNG